MSTKTQTPDEPALTVRRLREAVGDLAQIAQRRARLAQLRRDDGGACDRAEKRTREYINAFLETTDAPLVASVIDEVQAEQAVGVRILAKLKADLLAS